MSAIPGVARPDLVRRAFRLEWFTAGWMLIEAAVTRQDSALLRVRGYTVEDG